MPTRGSVDTATLVLTYDRVLRSTSSPSASDFTVRAAEQGVTVDAVRVGGSEVTLTLATAVQAGQVVTVAYEQGNLYDRVGKQAVSFDDWMVTNITTGGGGGTDPPGNGGGGTDPPGNGDGGTDPPGNGDGGGGDGNGGTGEPPPEPVPALPVAGVIGLALLLLGTGGRALRGRARG